jgi:hypothetical protein
MRGRPLDGHINRVLEGKTVERATKNGRMLVLEMTNGEKWGIAWATPNGAGIEGEPCLVKVDVVVTAPSVSMFGKAFGKANT